MKTLYSLALVALCLVATESVAQDTCNTYLIPNPHGAAMSINTVWVVDTVNFSVESLRPLPYEISSTGTIDIRVCILVRDGKSHSTIVRYTNTHGTSSYQVTMTAPATSGVDRAVERTIALHSALPNPASSTVTIDFGSSVPDQIRVEILDMSGRLVVDDLRPMISGGRLVFDVSAIANGLYLVQVTAPGRPVAVWPIIVQH